MSKARPRHSKIESQIPRKRRQKSGSSSAAEASPVAKSLVMPSSELVEVAASRFEPLASRARFLRTLTETADDLLFAFRSPHSSLDREFIEAVKRFKMRFPEPGDLIQLFSFTQSEAKNIRLAAANAIFQLGSALLKRPESGEILARHLFNVFGSDELDPDVRDRLLPALGWFAGASDANCETAFECVLSALRGPDERLAIGSAQHAAKVRC